MTNKIMPQSELTALEGLFKSFEELKNQHNEEHLTMEKLQQATEVEQIHIALYLDFLKETAKKVYTLRDLINIPEEDFIKMITEDGELSLEQVRKRIMMNTFLDMLSGE